MHKSNETSVCSLGIVIISYTKNNSARRDGSVGSPTRTRGSSVIAVRRAGGLAAVVTDDPVVSLYNDKAASAFLDETSVSLCIGINMAPNQNQLPIMGNQVIVYKWGNI